MYFLFVCDTDMYVQYIYMVVTRRIVSLGNMVTVFSVTNGASDKSFSFLRASAHSSLHLHSVSWKWTIVWPDFGADGFAIPALLG